MNLVRKIILKILKAFQFNTTIKHHLTGMKFNLNTYTHKGYWYYGLKREKDTIEVFKSWIKPAQYVLEIGGHIGYFTTFFAYLVGENGKVDVFEPGMINLTYLKRNTSLLSDNLSKIVTIVNKGAGDINGVLEFYVDPISGQNNSFVKNFEGFYANRKKSAESNAELKIIETEVVKLDDYFQNKETFPDFVKIDVEGFEWSVISGFMNVIENSHPKLMIEIQADSEKIIKYFKHIGYYIYNDKLVEISNHQDYLVKKTPNIFFSYSKV